MPNKLLISSVAAANITNYPHINKLLKHNAKRNSFSYIKEKKFCLEHGCAPNFVSFNKTQISFASKPSYKTKLNPKFVNNNYKMNIGLLNRSASGMLFEPKSVFSSAEEKKEYFKKVIELRRSYGVHKETLKKKISDIEFSGPISSIAVNKYEDPFYGSTRKVVESIKLVDTEKSNTKSTMLKKKSYRLSNIFGSEIDNEQARKANKITRKKSVKMNILLK